MASDSDSSSIHSSSSSSSDSSNDSSSELNGDIFDGENEIPLVGDVSSESESDKEKDDDDFVIKGKIPSNRKKLRNETTVGQLTISERESERRAQDLVADPMDIVNYDQFKILRNYEWIATSNGKDIFESFQTNEEYIPSNCNSSIVTDTAHKKQIWMFKVHPSIIESLEGKTIPLNELEKTYDIRNAGDASCKLALLPKEKEIFVPHTVDRFISLQSKSSLPTIKQVSINDLVVNKIPQHFETNQPKNINEPIQNGKSNGTSDSSKKDQKLSKNKSSKSSNKDTNKKDSKKRKRDDKKSDKPSKKSKH